MQIEKLNENKIRITLNLDDLKENNIDLHSFMASSIETQDLFYNMLDRAEKEVGFKTQNYKLMIEALAIPNGSFVLTVTRLSKDLEQLKKPKFKRKALVNNNETSIYEFDNFDNFIELCNYLCSNTDKSTYLKLKKSKLYKLDSKYYLVQNTSKIDLNTFKKLHCSIVEFGKSIPNSDLFERKLIEYGTVIYKTNAIDKCTKIFLE